MVLAPFVAEKAGTGDFFKKSTFVYMKELQYLLGTKLIYLIIL